MTNKDMFRVQISHQKGGAKDTEFEVRTGTNCGALKPKDVSCFKRSAYRSYRIFGIMTAS
jgi:hypothetical protein